MWLPCLINRSLCVHNLAGWTYAIDFTDIVRLLNEDLSHATRHPTDAVRRRRWIRYRQPIDDASTQPMSPTESVDQKQSLGSSSASNTWAAESGHGNDYVNPALDDDDPFYRTAQKTQSGFRVNVNFAHRGKKDNTKDYQSINLSDVMWLVNAHDVTNAPTDELMREKTANLEEQIKDATVRSKTLEKELRSQHDKQAKDLSTQKKKYEALMAQYKKIKQENETLQTSVDQHRSTVDALRKEAVRFADHCRRFVWDGAHPYLFVCDAAIVDREGYAGCTFMFFCTAVRVRQGAHHPLSLVFRTKSNVL